MHSNWRLNNTDSWREKGLSLGCSLLLVFCFVGCGAMLASEPMIDPSKPVELNQGTLRKDIGDTLLGPGLGLWLLSDQVFGQDWFVQEGNHISRRAGIWSLRDIPECKSRIEKYRLLDMISKISAGTGIVILAIAIGDPPSSSELPYVLGAAFGGIGIGVGLRFPADRSLHEAVKVYNRRFEE